MSPASVLNFHKLFPTTTIPNQIQHIPKVFHVFRLLRTHCVFSFTSLIFLRRKLLISILLSMLNMSSFRPSKDFIVYVFSKALIFLQLGSVKVCSYMLLAISDFPYRSAVNPIHSNAFSSFGFGFISFIPPFNSNI